MADITDAFAAAFPDGYAVAKPEARAIGPALETALGLLSTAIAAGLVSVFATKADLLASSTEATGAYVYADGTSVPERPVQGNNGLWVKEGGTWTYADSFVLPATVLATLLDHAAAIMAEAAAREAGDAASASAVAAEAAARAAAVSALLTAQTEETAARILADTTLAAQVTRATAALAGYADSTLFATPVTGTASSTGTQARGPAVPTGRTGSVTGVRVFGMVAGTMRFHFLSISAGVATLRAIATAAVAAGDHAIVFDTPVSVGADWYVMADSGTPDGGARLSGGVDGLRTTVAIPAGAAVGDTFSVVATTGGAPQIQLLIRDTVKDDFRKFLGLGGPMQDVPTDLFPGRVSTGNIMTWQSTGAGDGRARMAPWAMTAGKSYYLLSYLVFNAGETKRPAEEFRGQISTSAGSSSGVSDYVVLTPGKLERIKLTPLVSGNYGVGTRAIQVRGGAWWYMVVEGDGDISPASLGEGALEHVLPGLLAAALASARTHAPAPGAGIFDRRDSRVSYRQADGSLAGLVTSGTVSVAGQTITLTGSAAVHVPLGAQDVATVVEAVVKISAGQTLALRVHDSGGDRKTITFDPVAGTVTDGTTVWTPASGLVMTSEFRIRVCVDHLSDKLQLALLYYNAVGAANVDRQRLFFITDLPLGQVAHPDLLKIVMTGTGAGTVRGLVAHEPSIATLGSSIMAGSENFSPYPGFKSNDDPMNAPGYWLEQAAGGAIGVMNFGLASGGTQDCADNIANVLKFCPKVIIGDLAITNGINGRNEGAPEGEAAIRTNLALVADACRAAGVGLVVQECMMRTAFDSSERASCLSVNAWLWAQAASAGWRVGACYAASLDPGTPTRPLPMLCPDGVHPGPLGHRWYASRAIDALARAA